MRRARSATATYLYCLVRRDSVPEVAGAPPGLPQTGDVKALAAGDRFWLIAADAPLARYGARAIERGLKDLQWVSACAVAHEAVVEHFARAGALIPMKLFTLFSSEQRALAYIKRTRPRLERILRRVGGREEWGVRVSLDEARARSALRRAGFPEGLSGPSGTQFLLRKKEEQAAGRRIFEEARTEGERVFRDLRRHADESRRRPPARSGPGTRLVLDAAFLVAEKKRPSFQAAATRAAARLLGKGCDLTLTGPWPAYNFVVERA